MTQPADTAAAHALAALRMEIDEVDLQILALVEKRNALASRIGRRKSAGENDVLPLRPDREDHILRALLAKAAPSSAGLVVPVWREIIGGGLSHQTPLDVLYWTGGDERVEDAAYRRFGSQATHHAAADPLAALDAAARGAAVAVLAWAGSERWAGRLAETDALWIFDRAEGEAPDSPLAVAVGRIDPSALASGGPAFVVGDGRLSVRPDGELPSRADGGVGRAPALGM